MRLEGRSRRREHSSEKQDGTRGYQAQEGNDQKCTVHYIVPARLVPRHK